MGRLSVGWRFACTKTSYVLGCLFWKLSKGIGKKMEMIWFHCIGPWMKKGRWHSSINQPMWWFDADILTLFLTEMTNWSVNLSVPWVVFDEKSPDFKWGIKPKSYMRRSESHLIALTQFLDNSNANWTSTQEEKWMKDSQTLSNTYWSPVHNSPFRVGCDNDSVEMEISDCHLFRTNSMILLSLL
jgi:hypothetical protein